MSTRSTSTAARRARIALLATTAAAALALTGIPLSAAAGTVLPEPPAGEFDFTAVPPVEVGAESAGPSLLGTSDGDDWYYTRISGADRYEVAANMYEPYEGADVVYIASGEKYPDALSAGPAAVQQSGALLLTAQSSLPAITKSTIQRLGPNRIVVVGGEASVSAAVYGQLAALAPNITRIGGADRYAVSRNVVRYAFGDTGVSEVFVATGTNFPDALAAGPAAGYLGGAVLLVNGWGNGIDGETSALLDNVGADNVRIAGGPNSVNASVEAGLLAEVGSVERYSGADRFAVAANIGLDVWPGKVQWTFVASGAVFADALSAGPVAAYFGAPLLLAQRDCYPQSTADALFSSHLNPTYVGYVGGPNTLGAGVYPDSEMYLC